MAPDSVSGPALNVWDETNPSVHGKLICEEGVSLIGNPTTPTYDLAPKISHSRTSSETSTSREWPTKV